MNKNLFTSLNIKSSVLLLGILSLYLITITGCKKDEAPDFTADFTYSFLNDNKIRFENTSSGEYYSLIWDFANGESDTTTDKKKIYDIYYPLAGDYTVSLKLTNYTGVSESTSQTINITNTELIVSFTAEIDPAEPNYVNLTNTSLGDFDSFQWIYRDTEVENETVHLAYFPYAGTYEIELMATKSGVDYSSFETVIISQDDPNYNPNLIWADEFDYTGLPDPLKWNMETGGGGWGNNELQYYTDSESNAKVDNGVLTITAKEESLGGRDYTSARITTQNKFDFKYGRIEARIKLPYGQGLWPAFWMLGDDFNTSGWPACGEIDIMELVGGDGKDNTVYSTLHWDNNGEHASYGESYSLPTGIFADDFHVFSVEWDSQSVKGFVDDYQYFIIDITDSGLSEFHHNFFVILNLAVGGNWPGPPNASTSFPQTMEVDYVRVYQE